MEPYQQIIDKLKLQFESDSNVVAMIVIGSVSRGDVQYGNDLDILLVIKSDNADYSKEYLEGDILVEIGAGTLDNFLTSLENNIMKSYMYLDAKAIFDRDNVLTKLKEKSQYMLDNYKPNENEIKGLRKWLQAAKIKIVTAQKANDQLKLGFNVSNILWKVIEGLYMVNNIPVPASTSAYIRIKALKKLPDNFEDIWRKVLEGDLVERSDNTLKLIDFILNF